jgi:transcriptional regulator with XRE-family HTH domain
MDLSAHAVPFGPRLRHWRQQRGLSQLALALQAEVSTRHLSWLETGRAQPSRAMVLRLATQLQVPLAERNQLLVAAGHAPAWPRRTLDDPALGIAWPISAGEATVNARDQSWPGFSGFETPFGAEG